MLHPSPQSVVLSVKWVISKVLLKALTGENHFPTPTPRQL